jgi:hypothetical protein
MAAPGGRGHPQSVPGLIGSATQRAAQFPSTTQTNALGHDRAAHGSPHEPAGPRPGTVAQPATARQRAKQSATHGVDVFMGPTVAPAWASCQCRRAQ